MPTARTSPKKPTGTRELRHATLQRVFLEHFSQQGNITRAAQHAGVQRVIVYRWLEHDEPFALAFHQAELAAVEYLEGVAFDRATSQTEPSDRLLEFLLRARAPHKYRDRVEQTTSGRITVEYVNNWRTADSSS